MTKFMDIKMHYDKDNKPVLFTKSHDDLWDDIF